MNEWSGEGAPTGSPMPKSISLLWKGENSTVDDVMIAYLSLVGLLGIYSGCHDDFPCWMMIQYLPNWVGDHLFLITNWILEDN